MDYYALSFVRNADVIYELKRWLSQQGEPIVNLHSSFDHAHLSSIIPFPAIIVLKHDTANLLLQCSLNAAACWSMHRLLTSLLNIASDVTMLKAMSTSDVLPIFN